MASFKPSTLIKALLACIKAKRPCFIWGQPGIGKSEIVALVAKQLGLELIDLRAVLLDPVDLRGLPFLKDGITHWAIPSFLPTKGNGILFLDELAKAPPLVQAALYQLILDRKLGDYTLPDGWVIVAAGNGAGDGAGVTAMLTPLRSRFVHLPMAVDFAEWREWAITNQVEPAVVAFLSMRPELLHKFDRDAQTFPCPRTWKFVSDMVATKLDHTIEAGVIEGSVGTGAAVEFMAFLSLYRNCPSIDEILKAPKTSDVPEQPAVRWAIASALAVRATVKNMNAVVTYLSRLPQEYYILGMKELGVRNQSLCKTPEFIAWAVKYADVVL